MFTPVALETLGSANSEGAEFLSEINAKLSYVPASFQGASLSMKLAELKKR